MFVQEYVQPYKRALKIVSSKYSLFKLHFVLVLTFMFALAGLGALTPYFLRETINALSNPDAKNVGIYVYMFACAYAFSWTLTNAMHWIKYVATAYVMTRCDAAFYDRLFSHVINMPFDKQKTVDRGIAIADFDRARSSFGLINQAVFWTLVPLLFELVLVFGVLWNLTHIMFAAIFVCCMMVLFYIAYKIAQKSASFHGQIFSSANSLSSFLSERLGAFYDIKINQSEEREQQNLAPVLNKYVKALFTANSKMGLLMGFQMASIGVVLLVFTMYTAFSTLNGVFNVGDFVMVTSYTVQLTTPFVIIAGSLINLKRSYIALNSGLKYFDIESEVKDSRNSCSQLSSTLFQVVPIKSLSNTGMGVDRFNIYKGKMYAVCGPSGAGKTSLINAMLGLDHTEKYDISFCGQDVKGVAPECIAERVSVVPQDPFIFASSIRDNLLYGTDLTVPDEELMQLIKKLNLESIFDSAPSGTSLDMEIGQHVRPLSGGERQRIAIARALLRNRDIMILDEPTSALDLSTEENVLRYLKDSIETLIVITHRSFAKELADEVIEFYNHSAPKPHSEAF